MATRARLEQALINADAAGDVEAAKAFAAAIRNGQYDDNAQQEQSISQSPQDQNREQSIVGGINQAILSNPIGRGAAEFSSSFNRGALGLVDVATSPINAALDVAGSDYRIPSAVESLKSATQGNFMEQGLGRDVVRGVGEVIPSGVAVGGAIRSLATPLTGAVSGQIGNVGTLPSLASGAESVGAGVLRQMGQSTAAQDAVYSGLSGGGGAIGREYGGDTGGLIGSVLAPITAAGGVLSIKAIANAGKAGIDALFGATKGMSDDGAATMLAEAMVREGMSPDDVASKMAAMGDEGMLADVGTSFSRLLRAASNKIPRIQGVASQKFNARQSGQSARISDSLDDGTGTPLLTVDDEIARLENTMAPKIKKLYEVAKSTPINMSPRLKGLMSGDNAIGRAAKEAARNLEDYKAIGNDVTDMSLIDETKKILDAQIGKAARDGDKGTSSRILQLKKVLVDEADAAAPEYAQARSLFAGKEQLKSAAEQGELFLKTNQRDLKQIVGTYGESERRMYKLGAKQAILDRFDNINANYDLVSRTFGKNGDAAKLKTLFDTPEQHSKFVESLEREANWVLTRRAAQSNSTTAQQLSDENSYHSALTLARDAISSPMGAANSIGKIVSGLGKKKGSDEFIGALEKAGDILLETGMKPSSVADLLKKGDVVMIEKALNNKVASSKINAPSLVGGLGTDQQESTRPATR